MFEWLRSKDKGRGATRPWLNSDSIYQGFPIYFRRLDIRPAEYKHLARQYPVRVAITHYLDRMKDNGLPETEYNNSLAEFDHALITLFHESDAGIAFLVETLAGKRTYYFYAREGYEESQLIEFQGRFSNEKLEWVLKQDRAWVLATMYAKDFAFE